MARVTKPAGGAETFTEEVHGETDHTGIDGVLSEETFTQEVHDLEDHSSIPGVPDVTGLLDETAHDELDHTGLTGVPSVEGLLDETAHDELDHTGLTGIPDEFDWDMDAATPHSNVNHEGLVGIPSIEGLLDESAHDALDHTGLTGVGSAAGTWTSEDNEVGASSWLAINLEGVEPATITKLHIFATNMIATPDLDYDIEIYTDAGYSVGAYIARGIEDINYVDAVPWEWFGGTTMYIKIINNIATMIEELDLTIYYRR